MIEPAVQVLERLTIVAPLGLRFRDQVTGAFVTEGLKVSLYEPGKPFTRVPAQANRSGVYAIHHAPGLTDFEHGVVSVSAGKSFVVEVTDGGRRFQPFQFTADLPVPGILNWVNAFGSSPPATIPSIPLYSTPVRSVPSGMAVLRADLWDAVNQIPAAWAVLEAYTNNQFVGRGVADDKGRIALIFPHPAPLPFAISSPLGSSIESPPAATGPPLTNQIWPIALRAMYTPFGELPSLPGELGPEPQLPDLSVVFSQREATLWADSARTETLGEVALRYGRELILQSRSGLVSPPAPHSESTLLITPAVSPP
jgi:hypothetical protein